MNPATQFFSALCAGYPPDDSLRLEIRPLLPEWRKEEMRADGATEDDIKTVHASVRAWYVLESQFLANAAAYCERMASDFDVYCGVLPRRERTGRQEDVSLASCLFADVDGGDEGPKGAAARVKASGVPLPHIANLSGGGLHLYWFLSEPVCLPDHTAREAYKRVLRRLCRKIGGASPAAHADFSATEVARILRVPGTLNHKQKENPRAVKTLRFTAQSNNYSATVPDSEKIIIPFDTREYTWWRRNLPPEPETKWNKPAPIAFTDAGFVADWLQRWTQKGYSEGHRHQDLTGAAAWLVRDCKLSKPTALSLLSEKARHSPGRRAITQSELEEMIAWA